MPHARHAEKSRHWCQYLGTLQLRILIKELYNKFITFSYHLNSSLNNVYECHDNLHSSHFLCHITAIGFANCKLWDFLVTVLQEKGKIAIFLVEKDSLMSSS